MIVVADAGPILHLHWIGCLSWGLPPAQIHVVEQVWTEIAQYAPNPSKQPPYGSVLKSEMVTADGLRPDR